MRRILLMALFSASLICQAAVSAAQPRPDFVPKPVSVEYGEGCFLMDKHLTIAGGNSFNASYLKEHLERVFCFDVPVLPAGNSASIEMVSVRSMGDEEYSIEVTGDRILILSTTRAGEFYAIQTLLQMMPAGVYKPVSTNVEGMMLREWKVPAVKVSDSPRFAYRGNMFDVSRTFFDKDYMLRHIDFLAYHKINKLHWHLVDDNGWRVEIKKYPKLTQVGAWRGADEALPPAYNSGAERYGGFYTQDEIREIVSYAADRNIEIIPEIDLPGHSKSVAVSYPEILCSHDKDLLSVQGESKNVFCVGKESNYRMLDNIMKEIASLFPSKYINIGGDEVVTESWKYCPDCQAVMNKMGYTDEKQLMEYFVERMEKIVNRHGKLLAGWEDIRNGNVDRSSRIFVWHSKYAKQSVEKGFPTVVQPCEYAYFDMKYSLEERGHTWAAVIPVETAYSFDPITSLGIPEDKEDLILGPQGGLWTEMLYFPPHFADYQLYPRMCAIAEIGWTPQEMRNYEDFDARLSSSHFERMYQMGIRFRLPMPEVRVKKSAVTASAPYDNMVVRYTTDGTSPGPSSPVVTGDILSDNLQDLRFATFYNDLKSIDAEVPGCRTYLTPKTRVTTTFEPARGYAVSNLEQYDFSRYFLTLAPQKKGDYVLWEFEEPVVCDRITVQTSDPVNKFFGVTDSHAEISYDGVTFESFGDLDIFNRAVKENIEKPVKAVRLVVDGVGEQKAVSIQSLRIEPKYR